MWGEGQGLARAQIEQTSIVHALFSSTVRLREARAYP
jgi:hypothetical protein